MALLERNYRNKAPVLSDGQSEDLFFKGIFFVQKKIVFYEFKRMQV